MSWGERKSQNPTVDTVSESTVRKRISKGGLGSRGLSEVQRRAAGGREGGSPQASEGPRRADVLAQLLPTRSVVRRESADPGSRGAYDVGRASHGILFTEVLSCMPVSFFFSHFLFKLFICADAQRSSSFTANTIYYCILQVSHSFLCQPLTARYLGSSYFSYHWVIVIVHWKSCCLKLRFTGIYWFTYYEGYWNHFYFLILWFLICHFPLLLYFIFLIPTLAFSGLKLNQYAFRFTF